VFKRKTSGAQHPPIVSVYKTDHMDLNIWSESNFVGTHTFNTDQNQPTQNQTTRAAEEGQKYGQLTQAVGNSKRATSAVLSAK